MTSNDEWVRERAGDIAHEIGIHGVDEVLHAFGQEAIERGKAEQDAELKRQIREWQHLCAERQKDTAKALYEQDKAVAAERERWQLACSIAMEKAVENWRHDVSPKVAGGRMDKVVEGLLRDSSKAVIARLENPDEALVDAVAKMTYDGITHDEAVALCRDLARTLEGKENTP